MVSIFSSKNTQAYRSAKSLLDEHGIYHYTHEDYLTSLSHTKYRIYIKEEDYERSREVLSFVREERIYYHENFDLASTVVVLLIVFLILAGIWIKSY